jgi:hypothetical protein
MPMGSGMISILPLGYTHFMIVPSLEMSDEPYFFAPLWHITIKALTLYSSQLMEKDI